MHWYYKFGTVSYSPGNQHHCYSEKGLCKFSNAFEHHRHMRHCICPRPPILTIHQLLRKNLSMGWQFHSKYTGYNLQERGHNPCFYLWFVYCFDSVYLWTWSNFLYLDIYLCYKIGTGSYPLGNPLHPFAGEGWCKYECDVVLHCRRLGYSLPRVPNLTNHHLLRKKRKNVSVAECWGIWTWNDNNKS